MTRKPQNRYEINLVSGGTYWLEKLEWEGDFLKIKQRHTCCQLNEDGKPGEQMEKEVVYLIPKSRIFEITDFAPEEDEKQWKP